MPSGSSNDTNRPRSSTHGGVGHAELVEMGDPAVELTLVEDLEGGEVIEARAAVVEGAGRAVLGLASAHGKEARWVERG